MLEYACPAWHTSLAVADSAKIESIQIRALRIIEPELSYDPHVQNITQRKLLFWRENLSMKFFTAIKSASHKLHDILLQPNSTQYSLHNSSKLPAAKTNTNRFKSSLVYFITKIRLRNDMVYSSILGVVLLGSVGRNCLFIMLR